MLESITGTKYDPKKWEQGAKAFYDIPGPQQTTIRERFKLLPKEMRDNFTKQNPNDPAKAYFLDLMQTYRPEDQIKKESEKPNYYELLSRRQTFALSLEGTKERNREKLAAVKNKLEGGTVNDSADFLIRNFGSLNEGTGTPYEVTIGGKKETGIEISPPQFMKKIDDYVSTTTREGTSLDPNAKIIVEKGSPDLTLVLKNGTVKAVWYKKDKEGNVIKEGGKNKLDKSVDIGRRSWLTIESSTVPQKYRASAINQADAYYRDKENVPDAMKKVQDAEDVNSIGNDPKGKTYPLPKGKPATIKQGGYTYTWNEKTGKYE